MTNFKQPIMLLGLVACTTATITATTAAPKQPNIILVMCDDLGWGDVGFNGNDIIQTPNIDAMANRGIKFNRFYSACAVSSPTRASVLTGRNPFRTGVFNANVGILRPEEVTIPELLQEEGYATGHFGKWHLGSLTSAEKDANRGRVGQDNIVNLPREHGYDDAFVTESKVPTWDPMIAPKARVQSGWDYIKEGEESVEFGTAYWDIEGKKVTDNLEGDDSRVIMDRVLPFIKRSSDEGKPFLSVIWFHTPHAPCVAGPEYAAMYEKYADLGDNFKNYAGCITAMDDQMGRLLEFLEENGLAKNTIIWFCSDNGPESMEANGGVTGGFRERKRSLYEGGVRVPAFVYWEGGIKKPFETDYPAVTCDYLPTIANIVGIDHNKYPYELDGVDLTAMMKRKESERLKPIVLAYNQQLSYSDNYLKIYTKGEIEEAYDIVNDPYETKPLSMNAEIEAKAEAMKHTLNRYRSSFEGDEYGKVSYDKIEQIWEKNSMMYPKE